MKSNEYMEPCPYCSTGQRRINVKLKPCANGDIGVRVIFEKETREKEIGMILFYKNIAAGYLDLKFCPYCGKPQTYEAFKELWENLGKWGLKVQWGERNREFVPSLEDEYKITIKALENEYKRRIKALITKGCCNDCGKKDCEYRPKWGEVVRFNCPLWEKKAERGGEQ